ncbi:MAG: sulfatase-like hydrolase/transferase, partial [Myxococcota bacterium]
MPWKQVGALGALLAALAGCGPDTARPPRNLVLVSVDTLRTDRLGFAGHAAARTPTLDALAARGTWFANATTPLPRTTPAVASLFTGLWPHHHGSREVMAPMNPLPTLASVLALQGWRAIGVSSSPALTSEENVDVGFDRFDFDKLDAAGVTALALERVAEVPADTPV